MKRLVVKLAFGGSLAYDQKSGFRTAQPPVIFELLESFTSKCELAPPEGQTSNSISYQFNDSSDPANPSFDDIFEELERWHDVLEPHADELRGPRP
ncbi:hypothetical protein [Roseobacter cerasinus]|uniref:hypothetical protein n=1 Tax=Roseobacter cerasinus TaxID=2602289 RepID=UPI001356F339|nr:hypothetical protein [Roseobacter cerasinus]